MKRIKIGIAFITMFGLLLVTASAVGAKTTSAGHHAKVSKASTKSTQHSAKSQAAKKTAHKTAKHLKD